MKKNKLKNFIISSSLISGFSLSSSPVYAQSTDDLYKKVFGSKVEKREVLLTLVYEGRAAGEVGAMVQGKKILHLKRNDLIASLESIVVDEVINELKKLPEDISADSFIIPYDFNSNDLILEIKLKDEWYRSDEKSFLDDFIPYYSKKSVAPAPFAFQLNYKAEYNYNSQDQSNNKVEGVVENSIFIKDFVLDNTFTYQELRENNWYRENSVLTYDFYDRQTRLQAGDISNNGIGFLQSKNIGGVTLFRDFSLNPYRVSFPTSRYDFSITKRSLVRTFVNNLLIKSEYLNPGKHTLKDIPLNNGVNNIILEIEDEFGEKRILSFNEASSQELLSRGQSRFDFSVGRVSKDQEKEKTYSVYDDLLFSGYWQYGHRRNLTLALYGQKLGDFNLYGGQTILATKRGNLILDLGGSKNDNYSGIAQRLTYQLNLFGRYWYNSHTLTARIENRTERFNETEVKNTNFYNYLTNLTYSVPVYDSLNMSFGFNHAKSKISSYEDKFGGDISLSAKLTNDATLTFSYSRSRDQYQVWNTQAYAFLNFNFPENSTYASAFYDHQTNLKRLTAIHDNGKKMHDLKIMAIVEDSESEQNGTVDSVYNTQLADLGMRIDHQRFKGSHKNSTTFNPRILGGLSLVYQNDVWGGAISRPLNGSFAIFKPHPEFQNQEFGIHSDGNGSESKSGLFGETLLAGLTPYQYRQVQLDSTFLDPGYSLGQESFVLIPKYKSGHLFIVGQAGQIALRARLESINGSPLNLKVGYLVSATNPEKIFPFFTNRNGLLFVEGVAPGIYKLKIEEFEDIEIDLQAKKGFIDVGSLKLKNPQEAL